MSVVRAQELIDKASADPKFRQALGEATSKEAKASVIAQYGFADVTKADLEAASRSGSVELSDAELETVAGGKTSTWILVSIGLIALAA
jgi:predicted ribosomally synthesized peptide with nif11-like leader